MIITDVTTIKLRFPMTTPMADAIHYMPDRPALLVQVHTDEGIVGLGEANVLAYCASKACVISMTQSIALALAEHKINVNAIAPGVVDTPFWVEVDKQFAKIMNVPIGEPRRAAIAAIPLGRIEQPEDVAGVATFLASSDADYITQQCINVDGGNWPS